MSVELVYEQTMGFNCFDRLRPRFLIVVISFATLFAWLAFLASRDKSPTHDEPLHLYAGYSYLMWSDFRVNPEHPPLAKILAAMPLLGLKTSDAGIQKANRDVVQKKRDHGWLLAIHWLFSGNDADKLFYFAKIPMVALGVILGISIFVWAKELYGFMAGSVAVFIYGFDPNFLAHTPLIHNDVGFTLAFFAGTYFFWRVLKNPTCFNFAMTSVIFGIAAITKFSFITILPIWTVLGVLRVFHDPQPGGLLSGTCERRSWHQALLPTIAVLVSAVIVSYVLIWAGYAFRFEASPNQQNEMSITHLVQNNSRLEHLAAYNSRFRIVPEAWLYGMISALKSLGRPSYLFEETSQNGFWLYFPVAVALKTPLPTLLILIAALVSLVNRRRLKDGDLFLLVPVIGFFLIAVWSKTNIGLRHILPIYPFLFVWAGGAIAAFWFNERGVRRCAPVALGAWLIASAVTNYPHYLAFLNELATDSKQRFRYFVDSNLDWGQDLKGLKRWMDGRGVDTIALAYFGTVPPMYYGIHASHPPEIVPLVTGKNPETSTSSEYVAISATHLAGLYLKPPDAFIAYRARKPIATIGHSIFIYRTGVW